jgi:hypothetical protein
MRSEIDSSMSALGAWKGTAPGKAGVAGWASIGYWFASAMRSVNTPAGLFRVSSAATEAE